MPELIQKPRSELAQSRFVDALDKARELATKARADAPETDNVDSQEDHP